MSVCVKWFTAAGRNSAANRIRPISTRTSMAAFREGMKSSVRAIPPMCHARAGRRRAANLSGSRVYGGEQGETGRDAARTAGVTLRSGDLGEGSLLHRVHEAAY